MKTGQDLNEAIREHQHLVQVLRSTSHEDDRREAQKQAAELKALRRKKARTGWAAKPTPEPYPGIEPGDHLYIHHPERGPMAVTVHAQGRHGVTATDSEGRWHRCPWQQVLGVKQRLRQRLTLIEQGEDGAILEDETGKRRFLKMDPEAREDPNPAPLRKSQPTAAQIEAGNCRKAYPPRFFGAMTAIPMADSQRKALATRKRPPMIKGRVLFFKAVKTKSAHQGGLFEQIGPVKGYVKKDGTPVAPHQAKHKHAVKKPKILIAASGDLFAAAGENQKLPRQLPKTLRGGTPAELSSAAHTVAATTPVLLQPIEGLAFSNAEKKPSPAKRMSGLNTNRSPMLRRDLKLMLRTADSSITKPTLLMSEKSLCWKNWIRY